MQKRTRQYEVMFLVSQSAAADFNGLIEHINELLGRAHAEVVAMKKWDERRLAFEVNKQKRGVYILAYIRCDTQDVAHLERDCNISERILRCMILEAEHLTEEEMKSADAREELRVEARLRAERAAKEAETQGPAVTIGAPQAEDEGEGDEAGAEDDSGESGESTN